MTPSSYPSAGTPAQLDELGRLVLNVCTMVPEGVVCFLPSYDYERLALDHWARSKALDRIRGRKQIFREPRSAKEVDTVLSAFTRSATKDSGAVLFCVVGAKMSEGINFSDGMARCVVMVGLPYPDKSDPELALKMAYLDAQEASQRQRAIQQAQQQGPRGAVTVAPRTGPSAGQEYYENLCMRAVNQSIGRAIRHVGDYAAILLVDERYATKRSIHAKIPAWISSQISPAENFGGVVRQLREFFQAKKRGLS